MSLQYPSVSGEGGKKKEKQEEEEENGQRNKQQTGCKQAINCLSTTVQFIHQCSLLSTINQKLWIKIHIKWTPKARKHFYISMGGNQHYSYPSRASNC